MDAPLCPFCNTAMTRTAGRMETYYHGYLCDNCHAELRQQLVRPPRTNQDPRREADCARCAGSDLYCLDCGDPICGEHIRTVDKYATFLSPELAMEISALHGGQIYCPLCFQALMRRVTGNLSAGVSRSGSSFNLPVILMLLSLVLIIMIGLERCEGRHQLLEETSLEQANDTL